MPSADDLGVLRQHVAELRADGPSPEAPGTVAAARAAAREATAEFERMRADADREACMVSERLGMLRQERDEACEAWGEAERLLTLRLTALRAALEVDGDQKVPG